MIGWDAFALICDTGLFVLIWLVQLVIYPSFREIETERFHDWHASYTARMGWVVIPLMFGQLGAAVMFMMNHAESFGSANLSSLIYLHLFGIASAWLVTFALAVPLHRRLAESGKESATIDRLIHINWLRTASWTGVWAISLWRNLVTIYP